MAILVAGNVINPFGSPLTRTPYGHLQLVRGAVELEVQAPTDVTNPFSGTWDFQPSSRIHGTQANTPGFGDPLDYATTTLSTGQMTEAAVWNILVQVNNEFNRQNPVLQYNITYNSNSYVNTLLSVIGQSAGAYAGGATPAYIDIVRAANPLPSPLPVFPGFSKNALNTNEGGIDLTINGGSGVEFIRTGWGDDTIRGGGDNDTLDGNRGNDRIEGGSGNDEIQGGRGRDTLFGGEGDDTLRDDSDNINGSQQFGDAGNDRLFGTNRRDTLDGGEDNDQIFGGDGSDSLIGGAGEDRIEGGDNDDTIFGGDGIDELFGGERFDEIDGGAGNDQIYGGEGLDELRGGEGDDFILAGDGDDTLEGGAGNDDLRGGRDNDQLFGGAGNDTLDGELGRSTLEGGDDNDRLIGGTEGDRLDGGAGDDTLLGGSGVDTLIGGEGADSLFGGHGEDRIEAGNGDVVQDDDGAVYLNGLRLTGGTKEPDDENDNCDDEGDDRSDGAQNESDDEEPYVGSAGETYQWGDNGLVVSYQGATITIRGWSDGDLGITLEEGDTENDSPDCFRSPIVLDLDGDGVELVALNESGAFFDIDADGVAERTAWAAPDDGILAIDLDGDGAITTAAELFGYQDGDNLSGFDRLALLDASGDGAISSDDAAFADLLIWRDLDGDGATAEGELFSLTDAGVASISTTAASVEETLLDSQVSDRGAYTTIGGETREALDIWFRFNQFDARFDEPEEIDPAILALPGIRGNGRVADLHIAMALDPELRARVEALTALDVADLGRLPHLVEDILFRWTGVEGVRASARGENVDGRMLAAIEAFSDTPFRQLGTASNPRPNAGGELMTQFAEIHRDLTLKLLAQVPLGNVLFPEFSYEGNAFMLLAEGTDSQTFLDRLAAAAPTDWAGAISHWVTGLRLADAVYLSFSDVEAGGDGGADYRARVLTIMESLGVAGDYQSVIRMLIGDDSRESFVTSAAYYGLRADAREQVLTGGGDDEVQLSGGRNNLYWGEGQGDDVVSFRSFQDHRIVLRELTQDDIDISLEVTGNQIDVTITILASGETLELRDYGRVNAQANTVDGAASLFFDDGTVLTAQFLLATFIEGLETGTDGDDELIQVTTDVLDGGAGDDTLNGSGALATTYLFGTGSGNDTVFDTGGKASRGNLNTIQFGPGVTDADVVFALDATGELLTITLPSGEVMTVVGQYTTGEPVIASFIFEDGTVLDSAEVLRRINASLVDDRDFIFGNSLSENIIGTDEDEQIFAFRGNDTVDGRGGDDFIAGSLGSDSLIGGTGNDVLEGLYFDELTFSNFNTESRRPDTVDGGEGDDTLITFYGDDSLIGGVGNDFLAGDQGDDVYIAGAGDDTIYEDQGTDEYRFGLGDGADIVMFDNASFEDDDSVVFATGVTAADVTYSFVELTPDAYLEGDYPFREFRNLDGTLRDFIGFFAIGLEETVYGLKASLNGDDSISLLSLGFRDPIGASVNFVFENGDIVAGVDAAAALRVGTAEDQLIVAAGDGDVIDGLGGDDTVLVAGGDTTVVLAPGGGDDVIRDIRGEESAFGQTRIGLADGLTAADVTAERLGDDLKLSLADGSSVTVEDYFLPVAVSGFEFEPIRLEPRTTVEDIVLSDGSTVPVRTLLEVVTDGADAFFAGPRGAFAPASPGDDTLVGTGNGDTYTFDAGGGADVIIDDMVALTYGAESTGGELGATPLDLGGLRQADDTLSFAAGITLDQLSVAFGGADQRDLVITHDAGGASVTIEDQVSPDQSYGFLASPFVTDQFTGEQVIVPGLGANNEVTEEAWNFLRDNFENFGGGGPGGPLEIALLEGPEGELPFPGGPGFGFGFGPVFSSGVEAFTLDGLTYDRDAFLALFFDPTPTAGDDTLVGSPFGDTLDGGAGDDLLLGGAGDDVYILGEAYGEDVASDRGGQDSLIIANAIEQRALSFTRAGDDLLIEIGGPARSAVTVTDQFASNGAEIETIVLPDGSEVSLAEIRQTILSAASTSGDDMIETFRSDDVVLAREGDDEIVVIGGSNIIDGGEGRDTVVFNGPREQFDITSRGETRFVANLDTGEVSELRNVEVIAFAPAGGAPRVQEVVVENLAPIAADVTLAGVEDTSLRLNGVDLLALASDPDGGGLTLAAVTSVSGGEVALDAAGLVEFTPDADFAGDAAFDYTVADSGDLTATGRVTVAVAGRNDPPEVGTAIGDIAIDEDTPVNIPLPGDAFIDVDGHPLEITARLASGDPLPAWLTFDGAAFTGTPPTDAFGDFEIEVIANDGAEEAAQTFTLSIASVNDAPEVADEIGVLIAAEDAPFEINLPAQPFTDPDGDALTILATLADGAALPDWLSFDPVDLVLAGQAPAEFFGDIQLTVSASDGELSASQTATLSVLEVNDAPVAALALKDQTVDQGQTLTYALPDGAFTDIDTPVLTLTATLADGSALPSWLGFDGGVFTGTPPAGSAGVLDIAVSASDGLSQAVSSFRLEVIAVNTPPVVAAPLADQSSPEDAVVSFAIPDGSFADADGDAITLVATLTSGDPLPGWLDFDGTAFNGTPPADFNGDLEIRVTASDGEFSVGDDFRLTITPVNDAPVANDDGPLDAVAGEGLSIATADLLANDTDVDGDALTVVAVGDASGGVVALGPADSIVFTPDEGAGGGAAFSYTVSDGAALSTATVTLSVEGDPVDPYDGFVRGTPGRDIMIGKLFRENKLFGDDGNDLILGGFRSDHLAGGGDNDRIFGGWGDDTLAGGAGDDRLKGGFGDDVFMFAEGDGRDVIKDFDTHRGWWKWGSNDDRIQLDIDGVETAQDALAFASQRGRSVVFDFGEGDQLVLRGVSLQSLDEDDFIFG